MQQPHPNTLCFYFAIGDPSKTSLISQFCRQNHYDYLLNPSIKQPPLKSAIIEGRPEMLPNLEKLLPELYLIVFGSAIQENDKPAIIQYSKIGKCKMVKELTYDSFQKCMYSNLILLYGPIHQQLKVICSALAYNLGYSHLQLPSDANTLINTINKSINYVVEGCFTSQPQLAILQKYFEIRIIHLVWNRLELPNRDQFFDRQFQAKQLFESKPYYSKVDGLANQPQLLNQITTAISPQLIYINRTNKQQQSYLRKYNKQTDGLVLSVQQIQSINKRRNRKLAIDTPSKCYLLNEVIYKDLKRRQIIITDFPWTTQQFIIFQRLTRQFKYFVDLQNNKDYKYSHTYSSQMYFLELQKRITPNIKSPLHQHLSPKNKYWIVNGPSSSGKTEISKYIQLQFKYQLIEIQSYVALNKDKINNGQQSEEVPFKKILIAFKNIIENNPHKNYLFDGFNYTDNEMKAWVDEIGSPFVINLSVDEPQLLKRMRKKNQSDLNAQITEEETTKVKQAITKNNLWIEKLSEISPQTKIFKLNYNMPKILAEEIIQSILKPRVFLVQRHQGIIFQNIAIRYNMGFVNLYKYNLKDTLRLVNKINQRDIIMCYYGSQEQKLISQDLYWIEKYIGSIRYLGIFNEQQKLVKQQKMILERPPKEQKKIVEEGQQGQKEQQKQQGEQNHKKQLDIYAYQWSKLGSHKNLSQWFLKLKKNVHQRKNNAKQCYEKFTQVINILDADRKNTVYEIIK